MFTRGLAVCLTLALVSVAQAGVVIDLVPTNMGPYLGGETFDVDYFISQAPAGSQHYLRMVQFDMSKTNPAIAMNTFAFKFDAQSICQLVPILCGNLHTKFESLTDADGAIVSNVCTATATDVTSQINLPASGQIRVGTLNLTLPVAPGIYDLDALNAAALDTNSGARIDYGFGGNDPLTTLWSGDQTITGGIYRFEVVPEPATLALLALGGLALLRRRSA